MPISHHLLFIFKSCKWTCAYGDCILYHVKACLQAARAEAAAWAVEYQPSWTYQDEQGSQGPFPLAELKVMLAQ